MPRKSTIARKMSIQKRLHGMDQFQADAIDPEKERCVEKVLQRCGADGVWGGLARLSKVCTSH